MEDSVLFPLEKTCVKPGTVLIETVLSGDFLYITYCLALFMFRSSFWINCYKGLLVRVKQNYFDRSHNF